MAKYKIVEPCAFMQDGKAVHHTEAGAVVELGDSQAEALGAAVERVDPYVAPELGVDFDKSFAVVVDPPARKSRRKSEPEGDDDQ